MSIRASNFRIYCASVPESLPAESDNSVSPDVVGEMVILLVCQT
jgi:hypothetical protein